MSMLLLVRSAEDVPCAVEVASEFLVYQRRCVAEPHETGGVIGIWLRHELDADLPAWLWPHRELEAGVSVGLARDASKVSLEASVGVRESFSLLGSWALCWIDGTLLRTEPTAAKRRHTILSSLFGTTSSSQPSSATGTFFPVFNAGEPVESIRATARELQAGHPQVIDGTWFIDDRERGIVRVQEAEG